LRTNRRTFKLIPYGSERTNSTVSIIFMMMMNNNILNNNDEWNFYFGRGAENNKARKTSRANNLIQELAPLYIDPRTRSSDKQTFAKQKVYDVVVNNGGRFIEKDKNITADKVACIKKIMQGLRDCNKVVNKQCKPLPPSPPKSLLKKTRDESRVKKTPSNCLEIINVPSLKRTSSIIPVRCQKRACVKLPIVEAPIIECVRDALNVAKISGENQADTVNIDEKKAPSGIRVAREEKCDNENKDILEIMALEPPQLENSFSALIMTDEITADLPTGSLEEYKQSVHARVQRLENLVAMLMQQKNEEFERLL